MNYMVSIITRSHAFIQAPVGSDNEEAAVASVLTQFGVDEDDVVWSSAKLLHEPASVEKGDEGGS